MSFVRCQIDLAVKNLFICFHKDAHLQIGRLQKQGLDDLLGIYNQGHNQSESSFPSLTLLDGDRAGNHHFSLQNMGNSLLHH